MHISMFAVGVVDCVVVVALVVAQPAAVARSRLSFNLNWDLQEAGSLEKMGRAGSWVTKNMFEL